MAPIILLIDDDPVMNMINRQMLIRSGWSNRIIDFQSAEDALKHLNQETETQKNFIILLDLNMPGMSGWDFIEFVENTPYKDFLTINILTSSVTSHDSEKALKYPLVKDYIIKPMNVAKCQEIVALAKIEKKEM